MDARVIFGMNLRKFRLAIGLSQDVFADKCNLHRTYISSVERFQRNISIDNIQRISEALGVSISAMFEMDDREE